MHKKRKHSVHCLSPRKTKRNLIPRTEKWLEIWQQQSTIHSEGREFRNNHRYAVVVQLLVTLVESVYFIHKLHKRRTKNLRKCSRVRRRSQELLFIRDYLQEFDKYCEQVSWDHRATTLYQINHKWNCRMSCASSKRRDISRIIAIWIVSLQFRSKN